jgi:hypothetical protein
MHNLGGERNAQKFLKSMGEYLNSFRDGETIYYLSKEGRERVNCKKIVKKATTARHYIMRNDLFIGYRFPPTWKNEVNLKVEDVATIVCDATFTIGEKRYIIEVDHTQKMNANKKKIEKYRKIIDAGVFPTPPVFAWVTTTEYRRKQIKKLCEGLDTQIYIASEIKN